MAGGRINDENAAAEQDHRCGRSHGRGHVSAAVSPELRRLIVLAGREAFAAELPRSNGQFFAIGDVPGSIAGDDAENLLTQDRRTLRHREQAQQTDQPRAIQLHCAVRQARRQRRAELCAGAGAKGLHLAARLAKNGRQIALLKSLVNVEFEDLALRSAEFSERVADLRAQLPLIGGHAVAPQGPCHTRGFVRRRGPLPRLQPGLALVVS
jgi:hypothetical protein